MLHAFQEMDSSIVLFIQENVRSDSLDRVMKFASLIGNYGIVWIAAGLSMLVSPKTRRAGIGVLVCLTISAVVSNAVIKNIVERPRPSIIHDALETIIKLPPSFSFPSGHACSSFASATAMTLALKWRGAWSFIVAALIAFSRVYVGVHYMSDVIFGAGFGVLISLFTYKLSFDFLNPLTLPWRKAGEEKAAKPKKNKKNKGRI